MACFIIEHSGHKCNDVNKVAEDLKSKIRRSIDETRKLVIEMKCKAEGLEKCSTDFAANVIDCESRISKRGEKMKRLIDQHVQALLEELTVEKCRMEFSIPAGGFSKLAKNHFVEKLLEAEKLSKVTKVDTACDICSSLRDEENDDTVSPATKYCCDCEQHLCQRCAKAHSITKVTKQHQVLPIAEISRIENFMKLETQCDVHAGENIKIYCMECKVGVLDMELNHPVSCFPSIDLDTSDKMYGCMEDI